MNCKHTIPLDHPIVVEMKPPTNLCVFCRVEELEAQLAHAHAENLAFNVKVAEEINEARSRVAVAESAAAGAWEVVAACRDLLGLKFGDDIREAIKNLNAEVARARNKAEAEHARMLERLKKFDADNERLKAHNDTLAREAVEMRTRLAAYELDAP